MLRHLLYLSLFLGLTAFALAHGIEVTKPAENSQIKVGTKQAIEWQVENVEKVHLYLQSMPSKTRTTIKETLTNKGSYSWTVSESINAGEYRILVVSTEDPEIHGIIVLGLHHTPGLLEDFVDRVAKLSKNQAKPVVACDIGETEMAMFIRSRFDKFGIPAYSSPEDAARAMAALCFSPPERTWG